MDYIPELYSIIADTYKTMDRTFDVPLEIITPDSELEDLGIDSFSSRVMLMNIESRMNVSLPVDESYEIKTVGDVITMIKSSK